MIKLKQNLKKSLAFGIIALFVGMGISPAVNPTPVNSYLTSKVDESREIVPITCRIFTLDGVKEITRELSVEEAQKLSAFGDVDGYLVVRELKRLGLLGGMGVEKAFSLINGDHQKHLYSKLSSLLTNDSSFNLLCFVNFTAGACMMVPPFPFGPLFHIMGIVNFLLSLGISPFLLLPLEVIMFLLFYIFIPIDFLSEFIGLYIPVKPTLFRGYLIGNDIRIKTTGLLGTKETYDNFTAVFRMRGFTGIWITNPLTHHSWCKGFALSVYRWQ